MKCPVCKKDFNEHTGRRPKKFCSDPCKVKYWNDKKRFSKKIATDKYLKGMAAAIVDFNMPKKHTEERVRDYAESQPKKHKLWKEGDPPENTFSFYRKYDCMTYAELESGFNPT